MKLKTIKIDVEKKYEKYCLIPLGDLHVGNINFDKEKAIKTRDYISANKNFRWLGMGDYCECISKDDKRFAQEYVDDEFKTSTENGEVKYSLDKQIDWITEFFAPIKDQSLGVLRGNHERKYEQRDDRAVASRICKNLGIEYLGDMALLELQFYQAKKILSKFHIYATHGVYSGRTAGGSINRLKDVSNFFDVDLALMGHTHRILPVRSVREYKDGDELKKKRVMIVNTGGFLETYKKDTSSYLEAGMYEPTYTGVPRIEFYPERKKIYVSV